MNDFQKKFYPALHTPIQDAQENNYCRYNSQELQLFTSVAQPAVFITSFFSGSISRTFGRRISIIYGTSCFTVGAILMGAAANLTMLIAGRLLTGVGVALTAQAAPIYFVEMAPAKHRGALLNVYHLFFTFGTLTSTVLNYFLEKVHPWGWRLSLGLSGVPAALVGLGATLLPDSPVSYVERGQYERGREVLQKLRGTQAVDEEFDALVEASHCSAMVKNGYLHLFARPNRPQLVIALVLFGMLPFTGMTVVTLNIPLILRSVGLDGSSALSFTAKLGVVRLFGTLFAFMLVDKMGRKVLYFQGGLLMLACQFALGTIFYLKLGLHTVLSVPTATTVMVVISAWTLGLESSWGSLQWVVPVEILPLECRPAGMALAYALRCALEFILLQESLTMFCYLRWGTFFFFGGVLLLMVLFTTLLVPETKRVPLEEVRHLLARHSYWKRYSLKQEDEKPLLVEHPLCSVMCTSNSVH